jgi:hypothetical protein
MKTRLKQIKTVIDSGEKQFISEYDNSNQSGPPYCGMSQHFEFCVGHSNYVLLTLN